MGEVHERHHAGSATYSEQYDESWILTSEEDPANCFRLERIKERVQDLDPNSTFEFGIGYDSPAPAMSELGLDHWIAGVNQAVDRCQVDTVDITPSQTLIGGAIREPAWNLESRVVDQLIAPTLTEVPGPRLTVRLVAGIPLLHIDQSALSRPQRFAKRAFDLLESLVVVLVLSTVFSACVLWERLTSKGPFTLLQVRALQVCEPFMMLEFPTRVACADAQREGLRATHDLADPMLELKDDPRVTSASPSLRRYSLGDLPQQFNVLGGLMSLVGPRDHRLHDVSRYEVETSRRLALEPDTTVLWQVEGRSDRARSEALELDLFYVETWSLARGVVLLHRIVRDLLQRLGAS